MDWVLKEPKQVFKKIRMLINVTFILEILIIYMTMMLIICDFQ